jgi:hypothetical protein
MKYSIIIILCICALVFLYCENNLITVTNIIVKSPDLPDAFDGYKIVHLSDLHGKEFGRGQKNLIEKIKGVQPDLIVFTGDAVDSRRYNAKPVLELMKQAVELAPVYFVIGNHEWKSGRFYALEKALEDNGIRVSIIVVSRGLGNSIIPQRLFNRPEIVVLTDSIEGRAGVCCFSLAARKIDLS